jgi:predicted  nucleic acid-binding Zn-ribbon protein
MKLVKRLSMRIKRTKLALKEKSMSSPSLSVDKSMDDSDTTEKTTRSFASGISLMSLSQTSDEATNTSRVSLAVDEGCIVVHKVEKLTQGTKVGISLRKEDEDTDTIIITSIAEDGLFSETGLKVGQKVLSINGSPCPKDTVDAARLIAETTGTLSIEADDMVKAEERCFIAEQGEEILKDVDEFSMAMGDIVEFAESDNVSVYNDEEETPALGEPAETVSADAALESSASQEANASRLSLTVVEGSTVIGTVEKPTATTKVGISLREDEDSDSIVIYSINKEVSVEERDISYPKDTLSSDSRITGLEAMTGENNAFSKTMTDLEKAVSKTMTDLERAVSDKNKYLSDNAAKMAEMKRRINELDNKLAALSGENDVLSNSKGVLEGEVSVKNSKIAKLESTIQDLTCEKEALSSQSKVMATGESDKSSMISDLGGKIAELEAEVAKHSAENDSLAASKNYLQDAISGKVSKIFELEATISGLTREKDSLSSKTQVMEVEASVKDARFAELESAIVDLASHIAALKGENESASVSMKDLEDAVSQKDKSLSDNRVKIAELEAKFVATTEEKEDIFRSKKALEAGVLNKDSKITKLESLIDGMIRENDEFRAKTIGTLAAVAAGGAVLVGAGMARSFGRR